MSGSPQELTIDSGGGGQGLGTSDTLVPKLVQTEGPDRNRVEFEPLVVTRLGGTLPWEAESMQLQCGETVSESNGDLNIRLVYHCVATHTQFKRLVAMRFNPESIKLISRAYTGPITFDELKFDRVPDANGEVIRGQGQSTEPLYTIQLQSKENNED